MRILIDEDIASRALAGYLREALGDDVLEPEYGATDDAVWRRAQDTAAAILTGNVVDFLRLARDDAEHHGLLLHGLLLVYRSNDREKDLRAADIARGVIAIKDAYGDDLRALVLAVNQFTST